MMPDRDTQLNSVEEFENKRWDRTQQGLEFRHRAALQLVRGEKVLDVGCGDGLFMGLLKDNGKDVAGVDISRVAVDQCREKGLTASLIDDDGSFPCDSESFDTVIALDVLEHTYDPGEILEEMKRVSKGTLVIGVPNFSSLPARIQVLLGRVPENNSPQKGHIYWFNLSVLKKLLHDHDLIIETLEGNTFWERKPVIGIVMKFLKRCFPSILTLSFVVQVKRK